MADKLPSLTNPMLAAGVSAAVSRAAASVDGPAPNILRDSSTNNTVEYVVFIPLRDLTRIPDAKGLVQKCTTSCMKAFGGFDYNRLCRLRDEIFPMLDGAAYILDPDTMDAKNTFAVLNTADKVDASKNGTSSLPRREACVQGTLRRNVLYKLLPKENVFVPHADWAELMEKSEIEEIVRALQAVGAIIIQFEHRPSSRQPTDPPPLTNPEHGPLQKFLASIVRNFKAAGKAAAVSALEKLIDSPLSGQMRFHINARPAKSLDDVLAAMGPDYFHLRRLPHVIGRLKVRMSTGVLLGDSFTVTHFQPDSTVIQGFELLQSNNLPRRMATTERDRIDTGFRGKSSRVRYETKFTVVYPDQKDYALIPLSPADSSRGPIMAAGKLHPLSSLNSMDDLALSPFNKNDKVGKAADKGPTDLEKKQKKELVAAKRRIYELSTDAYLQRSMLDFTLSMKGLPAQNASNFSLSVEASRSGSSGGRGISSLTGGGVKALVSRFNPMRLIKGKAGTPAAASASSVDFEADEEEGAIPEAIDDSRPSLGKNAASTGI